MVGIMKTATALRLEGRMREARAKHRGNKHLMVALTEEVGELARALLDGESPERVADEALDVACVALRILEEGDADFIEHVIPNPKLNPGLRAPRHFEVWDFWNHGGSIKRVVIGPNGEMPKTMYRKFVRDTIDSDVGYQE